MCQCRMAHLQASVRRLNILMLSAILKHTNKSDIVVYVARETRMVLETTECGDARKDGVGLEEGQRLCQSHALKMGALT